MSSAPKFVGKDEEKVRNPLSLLKIRRLRHGFRSVKTMTD